MYSPSPFELKKQSVLKRAGKVFDLTVSSPMQCGIEFDIANDLRYLASNPDWQFHAPDACGQLYAREAVAQYSKNRFGENLNPDDIFITSGSSESYSVLFRVLCSSGDCILTPAPGYPLIDTLAELAGLHTHPYFLKPHWSNYWEIDSDSFASAPPSAKIFLLIAPHNPTGHMPSQKEMNDILCFCKERNLTLVIDEVFNAYCNNILNLQSSDVLDIPVFRLDGLSKSVGLPHIKVGWIKAFISEKKRMYNSLEYVLDSQLNCSYLSQALCARILGEKKVLPRATEFQKKVNERLKTNSALLCDYFLKMGAKIIPSAGGWYQSFYFEGEDDEQLCLKLLEEKRILTHPGFLFDFEDGWLVTSLLYYPDELY